MRRPKARLFARDPPPPPPPPHPQKEYFIGGLPLHDHAGPADSGKSSVVFAGVHVRRSSGVLASGSSAADMRHQGEGDGGGGGVEYEIPENIKTLHHLALQYVNQVRLGCCVFTA